MVELAAVEGYRQVTVAALVRTAGVSKATFYSQFRDKEECFIASYDAVLRGAARRVLAGERADESDAVRRGFVALGEALAANPKAAKLALVESLTAGPTVLDHVSRRIGLFETLVTDRLARAQGGREIRPAAIRGIVAGVCHLARDCLLRDEPAEFLELADPLLEWAVVVAQKARHNGDGGRLEAPAGLTEAEGPATVSPYLDDADPVLQATVRLAGREGYAGLSPSKIRAAAHVSPQSFKERFPDLPGCFFAAIGVHSEDLLRGAACAFDGDTTWEQGVRAATRRLCVEIPADGMLARLAFVEIFAVGAEALEWRARRVASIADWILRRAPATPVSRPAVEASVAGAWVLIHDCIRREQIELLPAQADTVADLVLAATAPPT